MSRSERQAYFEQLIALRDRYAASEVDHVAVLSIEDAIRYVEAILTAVELDVEPWLAEPAGRAADETAADATAGESVPGGGYPPRPPRFASDLWPWPTRSSRSRNRRPGISGD